jgi:molybdate transport system substrate-binding protein
MRVVAALLSCAVAGAAAAADIRVLSAGAVEPGLAKVADQFRRETNNRVRIQFFAAPPQLERRLSVGDSADVLIAPSGLMNDQLRRGKIEAEAHTFIGRVGIGVTVRAGEPEPDIATLDRFKHTLLVADSIVYSQASSGLYLEKLFDLLGIA